MKKIHLDEITSTNTYAKENSDTLEDKSIIYTDRQTAGRGRFERKWVDLGSRNLYMTIFLRLGPEFRESYSNLTQYLSLVNCKTLEEYGVIPKIKWPNDTLVNNKKISGILSEAIFSGNRLKAIILGIGVNLNANVKDVRAIPDRVATALNIETTQDIDRDEFLDKLVSNFFKGYDNFIENGFESIKKDYIDHSVLIGEKITIQVLNKKINGIYKTINNDGTIKLLTQKGEENFSIGDILE